MPLGDDKTTVTAVVPANLKEKLKQIAKIRRWTLSQAVGALIEDCIDDWVSELGITEEKQSSDKHPKPL